MFPTEMQHIGKIDAVGTVQVFGYSAKRADHDLHDLIYLNYAGPPTASDAVWAMLVERRALDFTNLKGKPHRLRHGGYPGLEGKEAPFRRFATRIESLAIDHSILLDKRFFAPAYDFEVGQTFVFAGEDMAAKVGHHVSQCVDIAVFPEWYEALVAIGRRERLVKPLLNWAHPVYQVTLDRTRWTTLIARSVESDELTWPGEEPSAAAMRLLASADEPAEQTALLSVELPERLTAQGWAISAHNGTVQARGPGRSTRRYALPGSVATPDEIEAIRADIVREIEASLRAESPGDASNDAGYTVTHEGDWTWLHLDAKPDETVRERLKRAGFRWGKRRRAWYRTSSLSKMAIEKLLVT